jgi:formylmethanofuran dehydrogenase subunit B
MVESGKRKSVCLFCSLGCGTAFRADGDRITAIDYDKENPVNRGSLCPRGHYNLELINHPNRLTEPRIGKKKVSWDEAISFAKRELKKFDPGDIGIALSSIASNEDAYVAAKMADALGFKNISAAGDTSDIEAYQGNRWSAGVAPYQTIEKIGNSQALLIIGDVLTRSPVMSKRINQVKYGKRGNQIIVIDPNLTHTSWFATTHLKNKPGTEAVLIAAMLKVISEDNKRGIIDIDMQKTSKTVGIPAEVIMNAARSFDRAESGTVIFVPGKNKERNDLVQYFIKVISSYSLNKKHITFYSYANTLGVNTILDSMMEGRISGGKAKAMISLGEEVLPGSEFNIRSCFFAPEDIDDKTVLLPLASHMERKGSVTLAGNRTESFRPLAHKVGGKSNLEIMALLMDQKIEFDEVLEETNKVLIKGIKEEKVDLKQKISEAQSIVPKEQAAIENITHFGNNSLVKNFFWYRVNNG